MQIMSWYFALFVMVGLVLFHAQGAGWRRSILALMNLAFLASFSGSWLELIPPAGFLALSVVAIKLLNRCREGSLLIVCILVILFAYLFLKKYTITGFLDPLAFNYLTIGLGYIIFRVLHVLIDVLQMPEQNLNLNSLKLVRYFTSFLTLTAGPVQRYEDFLEQDEKLAEGSQLSADDVRWAFGRLTDGLFRLAFMSPLMMKAYQFSIVRVPNYKLAFGAVGLVLHAVHLLQFLGLHGSRDWHRSTVWPAASGEFQFAVRGQELPRFLESLAHHGLAVVQDLRVQQPGPFFLQPLGHSGADAVLRRGRLLHRVLPTGDLARLGALLPAAGPAARLGREHQQTVGS